MPALRIVFAGALVLCLASCSIFSSSKHKEVLIEYSIERGDTITSIARRFDVSAKDIVRVNHITSPRRFYVGSEIKVPLREGARLDSNSNVPRVRLGEASTYIGALFWPLEEGQITSTFGTRFGKFHDGVDIGARKGTEVFAAHQGVVVYSGNGISGYGNLIVIKGEGILSVYAHNRKNLVSVRDGVLKGELIAEVGATGDATAPHLHFEVRVKNSQGQNIAVDPLLFFPAV